MSRFAKTIGGNPKFVHRGGTMFIKVDGSEYQVLKMQSGKYIVAKQGLLGPTDRLVIERGVLGRWRLRKSGLFDC